MAVSEIVDLDTEPDSQDLDASYRLCKQCSCASDFEMSSSLLSVGSSQGMIVRRDGSKVVKMCDMRKEIELSSEEAQYK